jgi:hypothetical protein
MTYRYTHGKKSIDHRAFDRAKGCLDLLISRWGEELNVDDPKFPGDARNSHNHYTMAPMITNSCFHESASPRRLARANAMRTQARTKKQQSENYRS